ncbi:MAG TPA: FAD binding domain-containing protein [Chloroflexota bacterium]
MKPFAYAAPTSLAEAGRLLQQEGAAALAGGTQLLLGFKWQPPPRLVVNVKRVPDLRGIWADGGQIRIGALTTLADVRRSELLAQRFPVLGLTARLMAVPAVASMATVGGNIAWGSPQADLVQPLLALDATLELFGREALPLAEYLSAEKEHGALITAVRLHGSDTRAIYLRHSTRRLADAQICSVALTERRAVLGSCGPTPIAVDLPGGASLDELVDLVASRASPRDDFRASAAYRMKLVRSLTRRGLEHLRAH